MGVRVSDATQSEQMLRETELSQSYSSSAVSGLAVPKVVVYLHPCTSSAKPEFLEVLMKASKKQKNNGSARARNAPWKEHSTNSTAMQAVKKDKKTGFLRSTSLARIRAARAETIKEGKKAYKEGRKLPDSYFDEKTEVQEGW